MKVLFKIILLAAFIFASCSTTHAIGKTEKGVAIGVLGTFVLQELGILNTPSCGDPGYQCGYQVGCRARYRPSPYMRGYRGSRYYGNMPSGGVNHTETNINIINSDVTISGEKLETKGKSEYKW